MSGVEIALKRPLREINCVIFFYFFSVLFSCDVENRLVIATVPGPRLFSNLSVWHETEGLLATRQNFEECYLSEASDLWQGGMTLAEAEPNAFERLVAAE